MLEQAWTFIQDQLASNQFLSGGALLGIIGGATYYLKGLPSRIYRKCVRFFFLEFEILSSDPAYGWFAEWLALQSYSQRRARWLSVKSVNRGCGPGEPPKIVLTPAPGVHWLWWQGHFLIVNRTRKETPAGESGTSFKVEREVFTVSMVTRSRESALRLLTEVRETVCPKDDQRVPVYGQKYGDWHEQYKKPPRRLDSVIMANGLVDDLVADLEEFRSSEDWYNDRGIPYRRGYMLYGPPGSGKSSLVFSLCSHLKMGIAVLNLGDPGITDAELRDLLVTIPSNTVVLIEDIDCIFEQRKKKGNREGKLTFSGLLNALDGIGSGQGTIVFMTTNHIDKLDSALIRPGRCDRKEFIGLPDDDQLLRMFKRFYPYETVLGERFVEAVNEAGHVSMATVQGHFLRNRDSAALALENIASMYITETGSADESKEPSQQVA